MLCGGKKHEKLKEKQKHVLSMSNAYKPADKDIWVI